MLALPAADWFAALEHWEAPDVDAAMHTRCRTDRAMFCAAFFPDRFPAPFNKMHIDFLHRPKVPWSKRTQASREADAAPRGGAKSTLRSFAELLHDAVYGFEAYVAVISTTYDLAEDLVKDLHQAFIGVESYPEFHEVYGPFVVTGTQTDFVVRVPGQAGIGTRFKAFSFGGTIRGTKYMGIRPTKVLLDDAEHPDRVRSPTQREKDLGFLTKDVMKAGSRSTAYQVVGTVLHADSMLARLLHAPAWRSQKFQAVISWPDRMDLWEICRTLWADLDDPERLDTARAFYDANLASMDAGAVVLWDAWEPLWDLMTQWWEGAASFNSEKQNNPVDPTRQVYDPDTFARCTFDGVHITNRAGRKIRLRDCTLAAWLDPRASEQIERNDFAAIALVARDPAGYVYVLGCDMQRDTADAARRRMWALFDRYPGCTFGYENNGFQALYGKDFDRDKQARREAGKLGNFYPNGYHSSGNKNDRMVGLQPEIANGWIQFSTDLSRESLEQWRDIPRGTHDDGPDATERAVWLVRGGEIPTLEA